MKDEFHLFEADPETGLSSDTVSRAYLESTRRRRTEPAGAAQVPLQPPPARDGLRQRRAAHPAAQRFDRRVEQAPRPVARAAHALEQAAKVPLVGCRDLRRLLAARDRLRLPGEAGRQEPAQRLLRRLVDGLCEVCDTECIWSTLRAAQGLRRGRVDAGRPVVVKDNALAGTSRTGRTRSSDVQPPARHVARERAKLGRET